MCHTSLNLRHCIRQIAIFCIEIVIMNGSQRIPYGSLRLFLVTLHLQPVVIIIIAPHQMYQFVISLVAQSFLVASAQD